MLCWCICLLQEFLIESIMEMYEKVYLKMTSWLLSSTLNPEECRIHVPERSSKWYYRVPGVVLYKYSRQQQSPSVHTSLYLNYIPRTQRLVWSWLFIVFNCNMMFHQSNDDTKRICPHPYQNSFSPGDLSITIRTSYAVWLVEKVNSRNFSIFDEMTIFYWKCCCL